MKFSFRLLVGFFLCLVLAAAPAEAVPSKVKGALTVTGNLIVGGTSTVTGATVQTGNFGVTGNLAITGTTLLTGVTTITASPVLTAGTITANGDIYTIPDAGTASFVMSAGNSTIGGLKTFSTGIGFTDGEGIALPSAGQTVIIGGLTLNDTYMTTTQVLVTNNGIDMPTGADFKANGVQAAAVADASVAHNTVNAAGADTALDLIGAKINAIILALEGVGILAP